MSDIKDFEVTAPKLELEPAPAAEAEAAPAAQAVAVAEAPETEKLDLVMPTLSLESFDTAVVEQMDEEDKQEFKLQNFTEEEKQQINEFADKIDLHDSNLMVTYGAGAQKRLSDFSTETLAQVEIKIWTI